jgi:antitoxin MazE
MNNNSVRSKVVKIGNSRGIRIPRALLEQAGLADEVEMMVEGDTLIIHSAHSARQGWAARFAEMAGQGDDGMLEELLPTQWDEEEWVWE